MTSTLPHGAWPSPLSAESLAEGSLGFRSLSDVGGDLWWVEARPAEAGRHALVRRRGTTVEEVLPAHADVRSRVMEYGGPSVAVTPDGDVVWVQWDDQQLWCQRADGSPLVRLTPGDARRYLSPTIDTGRQRVIAVCEDHRAGGEPITSLVIVPLQGGEPIPLREGRDFYASPSLSPDGRRLAYVGWDHPNMPWDTTTLRSIRFDDAGDVVRDEWIAGGLDESVNAPIWLAPDDLLFTSDRAGRWALWRWRGGQVEQVGDDIGELPWSGGAVAPFDGGTKAWALVIDRGQRRLVQVDLDAGTTTAIDTDLADAQGLVAHGDGVAMIAATTRRAFGVTQVDASGNATVIRPASPTELDAAWVAEPEWIDFETQDGVRVMASYHPPTNPDVSGPDGDRPPLLVTVHGGPVGARSPGLQLGVYAPLAPPYWTSRGFAVVDLDYRGTTGFGRDHVRALYGQWGVADVNDAVAAARHLADRGDVDADRVVIIGPSAGGYTTLAALAFTDAFTAGINLFGLSDLEAFVGTTHKFEKHYLQQLIGRIPEQSLRYRERSPIHDVDKMRAPLLVLQGLDDRVVPPQQSEIIVDALRERGVPVAYVAFEGEGHGFLRAENIVATIHAMLSFLGQVLGIDVDVPDRLAIENL